MSKSADYLWGKPSDDDEIIPIGNLVICDDCNANWTDRPETGGFVFCSRAYCPTCAPKRIGGIKRHREEYMIEARCPSSQSFADFVREYRGPDAHMRIIKGEKYLP